MGANLAAKWPLLSMGGMLLLLAGLAAWGTYQDGNSGLFGGSGALPSVSGNVLKVPERVGAMRLVGAQQGREAVTQINQLHGHNLGLQAGLVASYTGGGNEASIWIAKLAGSAQAKELLDQMNDMIRPGSVSLNGFRELQIAGKTVYAVDSGEQKNYYFQRSDRVVWLSVSGPEPEGVLQNMLILPD